MELYGVLYGTSLFLEKHIYHDLPNSKAKVPFGWMYYLAKIGDKIILFDTGFREASDGKTWGVTFFDLEEELKDLVGSNQQVETVVITHNHFDHIDNLDLYEQATILMSKEAYDQALKNRSPNIKKCLKQNTVILVEYELEFEDVFTFKVIGGHAKGSSVIYFQKDDKSYVLTGDECYLCDNMLSQRPVGTHYQLEKNKAFLKSCKDESKIVLPCHDLQLMSDYPKVSEHIIRIV